MKIRIIDPKGYCMEEVENLVYFVADGAYTNIYLKSGVKYYSSFYLGKIGRILKGYPFVRISRSAIINFTLIKEINVKESFCVVDSGKEEIKLFLSQSGIENLKMEKIV